MNILIMEKEVEKLFPITMTRPAFDILCGGYTLYSILRDYFPDARIGFETRDYVKDIAERKYVNDRNDGANDCVNDGKKDHGKETNF